MYLFTRTYRLMSHKMKYNAYEKERSVDDGDQNQKGYGVN